MWVKAEDGKSYNLAQARLIYLLGSGSERAIRVRFPDEETDVVLAHNLPLEVAEQQYEALLRGLGSINLGVE
jgi:hypothetical protein